jgi:hypothetical protein
MGPAAVGRSANQHRVAHHDMLCFPARVFHTNARLPSVRCGCENFSLKRPIACRMCPRVTNVDDCMVTPTA